jgi:Domain of unknown function (DUF3291)
MLGASWRDTLAETFATRRLMSRHELAQLNIAVMKEPLESPVMADFVANLARAPFALGDACPAT